MVPESAPCSAARAAPRVTTARPVAIPLLAETLWEAPGGPASRHCGAEMSPVAGAQGLADSLLDHLLGELHRCSSTSSPPLMAPSIPPRRRKWPSSWHGLTART